MRSSRRFPISAKIEFLIGGEEQCRLVEGCRDIRNDGIKWSGGLVWATQKPDTGH